MSIPELNKATEIHVVISKEDGQQVVDTKIPLVVERPKLNLLKHYTMKQIKQSYMALILINVLLFFR